MFEKPVIFVRSLSLLCWVITSTDCPVDDSLAMLSCLKQQPVESLLAPPKCAGQLLPLCTTAVDGVYIPDDPETLLRKGEINAGVHVLMGNTHTEGYLASLFYAPYLHSPDAGLDQFRAMVMEVIILYGLFLVSDTVYYHLY